MSKNKVIDTRPFEIMEEVVKNQMIELLQKTPFPFDYIQKIRDRTYLLESLILTKEDGNNNG